MIIYLDLFRNSSLLKLLVFFFLHLKAESGVIIYKNMSHLFVPYVGKKPASMSINGHKLIILSKDRSALEDGMNLFGADTVKKVNIGDTEEEQSRAFGKIAKAIHGGVVVAPSDIEVHDLIKNLQFELPWLQ